MSKQTSDVTATAARSPDLPVNLQSADAVQSRLILWLITVVAISMSLFQLYTAGIKPMGLFYQRSAHLGFILFLAFLIFPITGATRPRGIIGWIVDAVFLTAAFLSGFYIFFFLDDIISRAGWWSQTDIAMGIIATIAVLEASRRVVGLGMTIIGLTAISYALAGPRGALPWLGEWMPGILSHRGASLERVVGQLYLGQEGIFGLPLGVAATYVFMFVLFGAFLEVTGAGKFFIDMAFAATGRKPGGPA
ncbi:TRAP transporter large permease subunit, partial [Pseudotabrizicola sp.]|uniref:TRAP transporter large permease subunit n=1 Tax=Pseudotabrizicola sp. TaxID=2939647 RepID=UPI00271D4166